MFYRRDLNDRHAWVPTTDQPTHRWDTYVALEHPVIVHGKMGGRYKKNVEGVMYALSQDHFLIEVDDAQWGHLDTYDSAHHGADLNGKVWHDLYEVASIREGYLFRKNLIKLFKVLAFLVKEAKKTRKSREKLDAIEAERGHRVGKCPVCFGDFIADKGGMVLHGYQRPGHGYLVGDCYGVNFPCLETSVEGSVAYLEKVLKPGLVDALASLGRLQTAQEVTIPGHSRLHKPKTYKAVDVGFASAKERMVHDAERTVLFLNSDIQTFEAVISGWKSQKWPRKEAPKS
jgi:hypothetical protein